MVRRPVFVLALLAISGSAPGGIYRWVDGEGNTHYGDRPPQTARDVHQVTVPTVAPEAADRAVEPAGAPPKPAAGDERAAPASGATPTATGDMAERAEQRRKAGCSRSRERLSDVEGAEYVYRVDGRGNRIVLTDAERDRAVSEARASVRRLCR